jgi:hypothetical protein
LSRVAVAKKMLFAESSRETLLVRVRDLGKSKHKKQCAALKTLRRRCLLATFDCLHRVVDPF